MDRLVVDKNIPGGRASGGTDAPCGLCLGYLTHHRSDLYFYRVSTRRWAKLPYRGEMSGGEEPVPVELTFSPKSDSVESDSEGHSDVELAHYSLDL